MTKLFPLKGFKLQNNLKEWLKYFQEETITLTVLRASETKIVSLTPTDERYYRTYWPQKVRNASDAQKHNFRLWSGREW